MSFNIIDSHKSIHISLSGIVEGLLSLSINLRIFYNMLDESFIMLNYDVMRQTYNELINREGFLASYIVLIFVIAVGD